MKFLRMEFAPLIVMVLALAQMATYANQGVFQLSYAVDGLFSFVSLATGVGVFLYLRKRDVTAARIAITSGVLFFILLFGIGEYIFATYYP